MKSRLAVSLAFILIGAIFTSHNTAAFAKLRSRTRKVCGRYSEQVCNRLTARESAPMSAIKCNNKDEVKMIHLDGEKPLVKRICPGVNRPGLVGPISPDDKNIGFDSAVADKRVKSREGNNTQGSVPKVVGFGYHNDALDFVTRALHE